MQSYLIDIPVLIIFFNRPDKFAKVFEQVRHARPSRLYLYQDGSREGRPLDLEQIQRCRDIADTIDWDCEVHRLYQTTNLGCDPSEFIAQKWMFATETSGIVLEDDDVPAPYFFLFCKELLDRYRYDERINMICGMNNTGISNHIDSSYLFTRKGSIWGWASWKRVVDTWDADYGWLDKKEATEALRYAFDTHDEYVRFIKVASNHRRSGKAHYESIGAASMFLNNRLNIVPRVNMISNIGVGEETTHGAADLKFVPRRTRQLLYMEAYDCSFPLKHPDYVVPDLRFEREMTLGRLERVVNRFEGLFLRIWHRDFRGLVRSLKRRLREK